MKRPWFLLAVLALIASRPALAGIYTDDLARCLVENTSSADRATLVRWIFVALAHHPAVSSLTTLNPADVDDSNRDAGALFMRLVTESCAQPTRDAVRYEGPASIEQSFNTLGQVAGRDLMSHPDVGKVLAGLEAHLDKQKLEALANPDADK